MDSILQRCLEVPSKENIDSQTFCRKFYNQQPVVLRKSVENWRPCKTWTPDYLKVALKGSSECLEVLEALDDEQFVDNVDFARKRNISPEAFVDYVFKEEKGFVSDETAENQRKYSDYHSKKRLYLRTMSMPNVLYGGIAIPDQIKSLKSKIYHTKDQEADSFDKFASKVFRQDTMQLWVGTRGNVTPLHYDRNHGLLVQILGEKQVILFCHEHSRSQEKPECHRIHCHFN